MSYCIKQLIKIYLKIKKIKTNYKRDVLLKVLKAKLAGTWEGGGIGGKNSDKTYLNLIVHLIVHLNVHMVHLVHLLVYLVP